MQVKDNLQQIAKILLINNCNGGVMARVTVVFQ